MEYLIEDWKITYEKSLSKIYKERGETYIRIKQKVKQKLNDKTNEFWKNI